MIAHTKIKFAQYLVLVLSIKFNPNSAGSCRAEAVGKMRSRISSAFYALSEMTGNETGTQTNEYVDCTI
jgi:hypothetical protein